MDKKEIWKDIAGYEGMYQVSNFGEVKSLKRKRVKNDRILGKFKSGKQNNNYYYVNLFKNNKNHFVRIHRIVITTFKGLPLKKQECNHIDRNRFNNHIDNLEWVTSKQNSIHSIENYIKSKQGQKHPKSKVSDKEAIWIKRLRNKKIMHKIIAKIFNITIQDSINIATRYYQHINHLV